jgi:pimeloyl-ACP methyl ester carboxylesterase
MGGLVARQFATRAPGLVRGIAMLGTPNSGVATDALVDYLISLAEYLDEPVPHLRTKSDVARRQLTRKDAKRSRPFLDELNDKWVRMPARPATLTVSGGKTMIEFGRSALYNTLVNMKIQRLFRGAANDGLVAEKSVDMYGAVFKRAVTQYAHYNRYTEYPNINHSNLVENTGLMRHVFNWLERNSLSAS